MTTLTPISRKKFHGAAQQLAAESIGEERISIITATLGGGGRIGTMLSSLGTQTLPPKFIELIIVENGHRDNTYEVVDKFRSDHPEFEIRYEYSEVPGVSLARNIGLGLATGKYVTFLDDDDYLESNYLLAAWLLASDDVVVVSKILDINVDGSETTDTANNDRYEQILSAGKRVAVTENPRVLTLNACKLIPRQYLQDVQYDETLRSGEDVAFMANLLAYQEAEFVTAAEMPDAHYVRVRRANSVSRPDELNYDFMVSQRIAVIESLQSQRKALPTSQSRHGNSQLQKSQAGFINRYLVSVPSDLDRARDDLKGTSWAKYFVTFLREEEAARNNT